MPSALPHCPVPAMRLHPLRSMLICFALLAAGGTAMAAESRQSTTDDACPDNAAAATGERTDDEHGDEPVAPVRQAQKAKPAASPRVTGGTRATPSRFHSFLPGMFR